MDVGRERDKQAFDPTATNNTEISFIRARRADVTLGMEKTQKKKEDDVDETEAHQKQMAFQLNKFEKRRSEAIRTGLLLDAERTDDVMEKHADRHKKDEKNWRKEEAKHKLITPKHAGGR